MTSSSFPEPLGLCTVRGYESESEVSACVGIDQKLRKFVGGKSTKLFQATLSSIFVNLKFRRMKVILPLLCIFLLVAIATTSADKDEKFEEISKERTPRAFRFFPRLGRSRRSRRAPARTTGGQDHDKDCYDDYPIKDGLLCYPRCKAGYSNYGQGPVCWAKCPPATTNIGISCQKDTYGRGVGKLLSTCELKMEKNGLLCYPKCKKGYYGVGPVCWQSCKSGYTDDGALCRIPLRVYGRDTSSCPWYNKCGLFGSKCGKKCKKGYVNDGCTCRQPLYVYAKKTYGRGAGYPLWCASNEEQNGALCYPPCKSGYYGVGPVCWSHCSGETTDTGADCLKKNYGRGVGKPLSCFQLSRDNVKSANISNIISLMKGAKDQVLTKANCLGLWAASKDAMNYLSAFAQCTSSWHTMVFSISGSLSVLLSAGVGIGIAVDLRKNKAVCYEQTCEGFNLDVSVGIAVNYGWFRSLEDIPGKTSIVFGTVEIPIVEIGVSFASVISSDNEYIGTLGSRGLGVGLSPLPFDIGGASCNTPKDRIIEFTPLL